MHRSLSVTQGLPISTVAHYHMETLNPKFMRSVNLETLLLWLLGKRFAAELGVWRKFGFLHQRRTRRLSTRRFLFFLVMSSGNGGNFKTVRTLAVSQGKKNGGILLAKLQLDASVRPFIA